MGLADIIEKGGIYHNLKGHSPHSALTALVEMLPPLLPVNREKLLEAVLEREDLMSTAIGNGIALPHPRNHVLNDDKDQFAALAFLDRELNWNALDGKNVNTLFLIVSASARQHLVMLSEITYFSRQENFIRLLKERSPLEEILLFIREAEKNWKKNL